MQNEYRFLNLKDLRLVVQEIFREGYTSCRSRDISFKFHKKIRFNVLTCCSIAAAEFDSCYFNNGLLS